MNTNENKNENKNNTLAYKIGHLFGTAVVALLALCVMAVLIALTGKFIFWLLW